MEISAGSCRDTSECVTIANIGLKETGLFSVEVFPNPVIGVVRIQAINRVSLGVFNAQGVCVYESGRILENWEIDVSSWPAGFYWVSAVSQKGNIELVLVKQERYFSPLLTPQSRILSIHFSHKRSPLHSCKGPYFNTDFRRLN